MPARSATIALGFMLAIALVQAQSPEQPRFRSGVSVLQLSVSAIDAEGRAVRDLRAEDFDVEIGGRQRKVLFARFSGAPDQRASTAAGDTPAVIATNSPERAGRAVVFMVDLESIRAGNEKTLLDTAAQLVDSLDERDAVSLVPVPGTSIDLTRDRRAIAGALGRLRGTNVVPTYTYFFTIEEAVAFERGDKRVIDAVIERECDAAKEEARAAMGLPPICPPALENETRERLRVERLHVQSVLTAVSNVAERLRRVDAPRTIVLISGGLAFEMDSLTWYRQAERTLKLAGVSVYAVHVHHPDMDASSSRRPQNATFAARERETGLANVATMAGGMFFFGVGKAQGVFDRMRNEIAYSYLLGVEGLPQDAADAASATISVKVDRPGARLRTTRHPPVESVDAQQRLRNLISQPIEVTELPLAATLYTVRGEEPDTLKAIVGAEIGRGLARTPPVRYALAVLRDGTPVFVTNGTATDGADAARVTAGLQLAPGQYRLRVAAVDAGGRGGSLEAPVSIGIRDAGDLQASDLMLGSPAGTFTPAFSVPAGTPLSGLLEVYSADAERFARARVSFELRRAGSGAALSTIDAPLVQTEADPRRLAAGTIDTAGLTPSRYTVAAIISLDGRPVGRVSRSVDVTPPIANTAASIAGGTPGAPAPISTDPALNDVLTKLAGYVSRYGEKASLVVGVEKYTQHVELERAQPSRPRRLVAEFALVKTEGPGGWIGFRDVVEVDGEAVQDRRDRLMTLFTDSAAPMPEATRIANESARFNVGPISRNFNVPTMALLLFTPENLARFTFTLKGTDRIDGVETREVAFRETKRPTMVMTRAGKDVPLEGTLWIVPSDGTVVRTRLRMRGFADAIAMGDARAPSASTLPQEFSSPTSTVPQQPAQGSGTPAGSGQSGGTTQPGGSGTGGAPAGAQGGSGGGGGAGSGVRKPDRRVPDFEMPMTRLESRADIEVTYRRDERLDMWLPSKMSEHYEGPIPRVRSAPVLGTTRTIATYADYRQFGTSSKITVPK